MPKQYNPADWYWKAGDGRLFSSARAKLVATLDTAFKTWASDDTEPQRWPQDETGSQTDAALQDVLTPYGLAGPGVSAAELAPRLIAAASAACDAVTAQVIPDATHQLAYTNAATIVWASGGSAPSVDPAKTVFAQQGASVGIIDPAAFATVVTAVSLGSMELATILASLKGAVDKAETTEDLAAALMAFEAALGSFVKGLNGAGLTVSVTTPPAITIPGVNA